MHRMLLVALAASTMFQSAGHVWAQENEAPLSSDNILDRIVVSAGSEKVAIDTPQAVSVLSQEDIDEAQATTVGDVLKFVPGVSTVGSDRLMGESFNIRGIGSAAAADESKIIMQVDGIPKFYEQYRMGSIFLDPELLKRVEVLRGPASSTLYGSGALGGVISMTTKDASDFLKEGQSWAFKPKLSVSSNGTGATTSGIFATRIGDAFEILAAGSYRKADSFKDGDGNEIADSDFSSLSGLVNAKYRFGGDMDQYLRLSAMQFYSDLDDSAYNQTGGMSFGTTDRVVTDRNVSLEYGNGFDANKYLDLKVNLGVSDTHTEQDDLKNGYASTFGDESEYGYRTYVAKFENTSDLSLSEAFQTYLTVGGEMSHQERTSSMVYNGVTSTSDTHPEGTQKKVSGFVQSEMIIKDRLTLIPGVRYDYYMNDPEGISNAASKDIGAFSPKLAAQFAITDNWAVFGSAAYTERAPTLDELYSTSAGSMRSGPRSSSPGLKPESSVNYEAGVAFNFDHLFFAEDRFTAKFTAFNNDIEDLIASNSGGADGDPYYVNISQANIYGFEIEAAYDSDLMFARAAFASTRGTNEGDDSDLDTIAADTLSTSVGFKLPDQDLKVAWDSVFAADQELVSSRSRTGGYGVHGISANWTPSQGKFAGVEARFAVENIFDRSYRTHLSDEASKGRTFKFTLSKSFGG